MKSPSALSLGLAIAFAFLSAANSAEERPNTTLVQKSKVSATKVVKTPAATATSATSTVKTGSRPTAPAATPAAERGYEGCHGKGSDA